MANKITFTKDGNKTHATFDYENLPDVQVTTTSVSTGGGGTEVVANPELVGTEDNLTGLEVGDTKYKVPKGYELHTYTVKTYISADVDYQQLRDDITNYRDIKIGSLILSCQHVAPDLTPNTLVYTYLSTGDESSYVASITPVRCLILYNSTNNTIEISSPTGVRFVKVEANPTLSGGETTLSSLKVDNINYVVGGGSSSIPNGFIFSPTIMFGGYDDSSSYHKSVSIYDDTIDTLFDALLSKYDLDWSRDGVTGIQIILCPKEDTNYGMFEGYVSSEGGSINWDDKSKSLSDFYSGQYLDFYFCALVIKISYDDMCAPHPVTEIVEPLNINQCLYGD